LREEGTTKKQGQEQKCRLVSFGAAIGGRHTSSQSRN